MIEHIISTTGFYFVIYFLIINSFYILLIALSIPAIRRRFKETLSENDQVIASSDSFPSISIVIPVHNEGESLCGFIEGILEVSYPSKEIIIVNDGSTDDSLQRLKDTYELYPVLPQTPPTLKSKPVKGFYRSNLVPNLFVIDKEQGGKSDANNAGINYSISSLIAIIDADTYLEKSALLKMTRFFLLHDNVVGQGGTLRILNGCTFKEGKIEKIDIPKKYLPGIQVAEYLRSFLYGRLGWNYLGGNFIISGAFGLFDRKAVLEAGGFDVTSIGEDFEFTLRLFIQQAKKGIRRPILFIPDPVAWTTVPETVKALSKQRARWHQGLIQGLVKYKYLLFNPKYGLAGLLVYPYYLFGEMLEPVVEVVGFLMMIIGLIIGVIPWIAPLLYLLASWGLTIALSFVSVSMEITSFRRYQYLRQILRLLWYSFSENFGFRQLYIYWRLKGIWQYFKKSENW